MTLTTQQKTDLSANQTKIYNQFNEYVGKKSYMGVYFNNIGDAPYLTFRNCIGFPPTNMIGGNMFILACVYNLSGNFSTQTTTFLS